MSKLFNINYRIHSLILHEPALTKERSHNDLHLILARGRPSPSASGTDVGDGGGGGDGMVLIMVLQRWLWQWHGRSGNIITPSIASIPNKGIPQRDTGDPSFPLQLVGMRLQTINSQNTPFRTQELKEIIYIKRGL